MTERNPTVVVTSDETLPEVIQRVRGAASSGRTVHLVVPIDSSLLLTASEFRSLKAAIDEQRLPVVMRTADPLRLQLGERLGVPVEALARPKLAAATIPSTPAVAPGELVTAVPRARAVLEPFIDHPPLPGPDPALHWPNQDQNQNGKEDDGATDDEGAAPDETASSEPALGNPPRRWLPVALLLAAIVLATFFLIRFVVPHAVVRIAPKTAPVTATVLFDVTANGQPLDDQAAFALAPTSRQLELVWEGSVPATGVRAEPQDPAAGPIELRNASGEAVTVTAGTIVTTEAGVEFTFVEDVSVPAADQATGEPGAATGAVRAVNAGTGGNVETGEIGGRLPNGIYYSNRMEPTSGGTDKEFPVVAQADLDGLSAAAREGVKELAAKTLAQEELGAQVVSAITISGQQDEFDHKVDDQAEMVSLRSTLTTDATTFSLDAATAEFQKVLTESLAREAPSGFVVAPQEIVFDPPREVESRDGGARFEVLARADAVAELDEAERNALAARLAGASEKDVAAILAESPEIAGFTLDNQPGWLSDSMPNNASRIQIQMEPAK